MNVNISQRFNATLLTIIAITISSMSVSEVQAQCYCEGSCMCCNIYENGSFYCERNYTNGREYSKECVELEFCEDLCIANGFMYTSTDIDVNCESILCAMAALYGESSEEVEFLRYLRDNVLSQTSEGRKIIKLYYQWSPVIVNAMEEDMEFREEVKELTDGVLGLIGGEI